MAKQDVTEANSTKDMKEKLSKAHGLDSRNHWRFCGEDM